MGVRDDLVVADQVVGVRYDLLLERPRHVVRRRQVHLGDVLVVETRTRVLADDVHQSGRQTVSLDDLRPDVGVHDRMIDRAPDVVQQRTGLHQVPVDPGDAGGDLLRHGLDGAAVDDDPAFAPRLEQELDAVLLIRDGVRQRSSPFRWARPRAPLRGLRTGPCPR